MHPGQPFSVHCFWCSPAPTRDVMLMIGLSLQELIFFFYPSNIGDSRILNIRWWYKYDDYLMAKRASNKKFRSIQREGREETELPY